MRKLNHFLLLSIIFCEFSFSQVIKVETLCSGLLYPVGIHNSGLPGDNRIFVLEKRGRIKIVDRITGVINATSFLDIYNKVYPISSSGDERGLLGLAFHPNYATNGYFYVNYINPSGKTIIARYQVSAFADTALTSSEQIIMTIFQPYTNHNGGNLMFGPEDGFLYISMGDGGSGGDPGNRAQNKDSLLGKMLRIDINNPSAPYYFSAPGNPFYGATAGRDEIFDWGLRNAWRCSFDRLTHDMWIADVGQSAFEEINFRSKCDTMGHNYGWRCYEANSGYNTLGCQPQSSYKAPVFNYSHSLGCSVTGGYVYRGAQEAGLFGKYLFTDYCQGRIWATEPDTNGTWTTTQLTQSTPQVNNNYSSFGEDVYGEFYLAGISSGKIYTLKDTACTPTAYIHLPDTLFVCSNSPITLNAIKGSSLTYNWTFLSSGSWTINSGQGSSSIFVTPDMNSNATVYVSVSNGTCSSVSNSVVIISNISFTGLDSTYCPFSPQSTLTGSMLGAIFSGPGVSGNVFDPVIAGVGTHTINYTYSDQVSTCTYQASGCVLTASAKVIVDICNGMNELLNKMDVKIFPNPGKSEFNLEIFSAQDSELDLFLSDAIGRNILSMKLDLKTGKQIIPLRLLNVAAGVYFLNLKSNEFISTEKILIEN